jgi:hypothetical protein
VIGRSDAGALAQIGLTDCAVQSNGGTGIFAGADVVSVNPVEWRRWQSASRSPFLHTQ